MLELGSVMYIVSYSCELWKSKAWEIVIQIPGKDEGKTESELLADRINSILELGTLKELDVLHMDESALFVLPLTLEEYDKAYPEKLPRTVLLRTELRNMTVAELLTKDMNFILSIKGIGTTTLQQLSEHLHAAHGLRLGLSGNWKILNNLCKRYIPLMQNTYRSHYETYCTSLAAKGSGDTEDSANPTVDAVATTV